MAGSGPVPSGIAGKTEAVIDVPTVTYSLSQVEIPIQLLLRALASRHSTSSFWGFHPQQGCCVRDSDGVDITRGFGC